MNTEYKKDSLVLYKSHPARILSLGDKIGIELPDGKTVQVREKDIAVLHSGPITNLAQLTDPPGDIETACEMLAGETAELDDLAELIYGSISPASVWAVCRLLQDGLWLSGSVDAIRVRMADEREKDIANRGAKSAAKEEWQAFLARVKAGAVIPDDATRLRDLADYAVGKTPGSRILKELGITESMEQAHGLLLKLVVWTEEFNPYIGRFGLSAEVDYPALGGLPSEPRRDLTHLPAFAIDDEGNTDPDDAVSIEGDVLWIHIADVAALVTPDSPADVHARAQAANLYLPEKTIHMLPPEVTDLLGLGLHETSPALSFGVILAPDGSIASAEIVPSIVKVTRLTYTSAQALIDAGESAPLAAIAALTERFHAYRVAQEAILLSFPEVKIRVVDGEVVIKSIPDLGTQNLVTNAMLMAGAAAAAYATEHGIPFPYTTQPSPETFETPADLAAMFAYRKQLKPSAVKGSPDRHAGLGLPAYTRATSPLRRYLDLIAHQQLRAHIRGTMPLDEQEIMNRIGASAAMAGQISRCERQSNTHWTLVYLMQHPDWEGTGIVVDIRERFSVVLIPELAMETRISGAVPVVLNQELTLRVGDIDLPGLIGHFRIT